jgi:uncharacterized repeat protein (TIGR03803 family)
MYGWGAVYKVNATTGAYTILHHFNNYSAEGAYPYSPLYRASDGAFYGTTNGGGFFGNGTIFKITTSGAFTVLHQIRGGLEGYNCYQGLVQGVGTDKTLYGCFYQGGPASYGSVFRMDTAGKTFTILHHFTGPDGAYPGSQLTVEKDPVTLNTKAVYGGTYQGGASGLGVLFKIVPSTVPANIVFTNLRSLTAATGAYFYYTGQMLLIGGALYGTTWAGGANGQGTIFKYDLGTSTWSVLRSINNATGDGTNPAGSLTADTAGTTLYGVCHYNGASGYGTVWKFDIAGSAFTVLHTFLGMASSGDGAYPYGAVYDNASGLIFGSCYNGGNINQGLAWSQTNVP